jgi:drug/metabolite transporter (DMT)-like permease
MNIQGIAAAIYASFFLALSQISLKKSFRDFPPSVSFLLDTIFALLIWIPISIFMGGQISDFFRVLPYAIVSAFLSEALYFYAISKGQLSITGIILASYPVYTILFSYFINRERLSQFQLIFVIITVIGTLGSFLPSKLNKAELIKSRVLLWPIIAAIAVGLSDTLSKSVINLTSAFSFIFALAIVQVPVSLLYLFFEKQNAIKSLKVVVSDLHGSRLLIFGSLFNVIGTGLLWLSFNSILASIASPITATSGGLLILLTLLFTNEKISVKNILAVILMFIGIFGLSGL